MFKYDTMPPLIIKGLTHLIYMKKAVNFFLNFTAIATVFLLMYLAFKHDEKDYVSNSTITLSKEDR